MAFNDEWYLRSHSYVNSKHWSHQNYHIPVLRGWGSGKGVNLCAGANYREGKRTEPSYPRVGKQITFFFLIFIYLFDGTRS